MKNINIKKSWDFSPNSKIYLHIGPRRVHIKGFGLYSLSVEQGEDIYASHLWTKSQNITYDQLADNQSLFVKPRMGKLFAFIAFLLSMVCFCVFIFTRYWWSLMPVAPFAIYALLYTTILKDRYLIIKNDVGD